MEYISTRIIDEKPRKVIVDENGKITNRNPCKEQLKSLDKEPRQPHDTRKKYTNEELLYFPIQFYRENGRPPSARDFDNNPGYPGITIYRNRYGSWSNALKLVGLDVDTMVKKGIIDNEYQKGRFAEILVRDHFKKNPIDLSGNNCKNHCDGICPNGKTYDVKSSRLHRTYYVFSIKNKNKEEIEIYYFLAFNQDWTKLDYAWRVPGEIIEKNYFQVGLNSWSSSEFTTCDIIEYDITDRIIDMVSSKMLVR